MKGKESESSTPRTVDPLEADGFTGFSRSDELAFLAAGKSLLNRNHLKERELKMKKDKGDQ